MSDVPATDVDIRAAYRILLGREADENGLAHYGNLVADRGLTLAQLRHDLMGSAEYRSQASGGLRTIEIEGVWVVVDPSEPEFGMALAAHGAWEPHIARLIVSRLPPGATFVDIGANIGVMALQAARAVGPKGRVIAFEPNFRNVQMLLRGVLANDFRHVRVWPVAASDEARVLALGGGSNAHLLDDRADGAGDVVQTLRADTLLESEAQIDLIKIDIEGHEPRALDGLDATLSRHKPSVICEFNPRCLRDNGGERPRAFAARLFTRFRTVLAVEHDGRRTVVVDAAELMGLWQVRNEAAVAAGRLPDGMVHFDLLLDGPR